MFRSMMATAAVALAFFGGATRSEAAIRLTVTAGTTQYYYCSSSTNLSTGIFTIDGYTISSDVTSGNHPGSSTIGTLGQTLFISSTTAPVSGLTVTADVIQNIAAFGVTGGSAITNAADIATLTGTGLLAYTAPVGNSLTATADVSGSLNPSATSGTMQSRTTVNGGNVDTPTVSIFNNGSNLVSGGVPGATPYTLSNVLTLAGLNGGISTINFTSNSSVQATTVPEPATVVSALVGLGGLGLAKLRRRKGVLA